MPKPPEDAHRRSISKSSPDSAESTSADSARSLDSASSEELLESTSPTTAQAPTLPREVPLPIAMGTRRRLSSLRPGDRLGEFELLVELGRGGFGCVFLSRQSSLDRLVALKITPDQGSEGRTLAQLEHENIVQVFSELLDGLSGYRLLCMQYVAGPTLQKIIDQLQDADCREWSGQRLLDIIDGLNLEKTPFDPTALRDRELLSRADWIETVCWIGGRLAEALAYAADRGVLHRDIKPANILFSQYGRPLLADFNLAVQAVPGDAGASASFGGTLAYMSPESLDAFNPGHPAGPESTDARSDLYSLGVVLFQLRHGQLPFENLQSRGPPTSAVLSEMAAERRTGEPRRYTRERRHALDGVIQHCLEPEPERRFQTAIELAETLEGCRLLRHAERQVPAPSWMIRPAFRWTFLWLITLGLIPHLIGSGIQIGYNAVRIVGHLTPEQHEAFVQLVIGYNLVVYPLCSLWMLAMVLPVFQAWRGVVSRDELDRVDVDRARSQAVELPTKAAIVGCVGWFPGAIVFPLGLYCLTGPIPLSVWGHFVISFALAGLIAVTYSFLGTQLAILRVMYPRMWRHLGRFRASTERELRPIESRIRWFQLLAGVIPLAGAVLIVGVSPQADHAAEYDAFRLLVAVLILMGMAGVQLANSVHRQVSRILALFTGRGG